jgi:hypothetical protein
LRDSPARNVYANYWDAMRGEWQRDAAGADTEFQCWPATSKSCQEGYGCFLVTAHRVAVTFP